RSAPRSCATLFPYTTLFRSKGDKTRRGITHEALRREIQKTRHGLHIETGGQRKAVGVCNLAALSLTPESVERLISAEPRFAQIGDRKSTRLNSSHVSISYAV